MRIRKKVLAIALLSTGSALLLIKGGYELDGLALLMGSLILHTIHIMLYIKRVP